MFDVLKADLKSDVAKELFLYYQGTTVVLQYLKPVNKVLTIYIYSLLKSDVAKELFLYYQGTTVVLQYLKPVNKVLIIHTVF